MQIVIEVSKEEYEHALEHARTMPNHMTYTTFLLSKGIPLPEHHGRLIDADAYIDKHEECGWLDDICVDEFNKITPTIIPATEEEQAQTNEEKNCDCTVCQFRKRCYKRGKLVDPCDEYLEKQPATKEGDET